MCNHKKSQNLTNLAPPLPQHTHTHTKSLATGLSAKEDSDEGAEKEDSDEGAKKILMKPQRKKILMKEQRKKILMKEQRGFWRRSRERRFWWRSRERGQGGPPPQKNKNKNGQIQLDHKIIIKGPKIWPIWTPPPKKRKKKGLATGLSVKEISDEGAEKEDSDGGAVREDSDEGTKKILMKEQTQARSRKGGGRVVIWFPPHPTPPSQMAKSNAVQDHPGVIIKE